MTTFVPEFSYEATTLDYLAPNWWGYRDSHDSPVKEFATREEAEAFLAEHRPGHEQPCAFRVREVLSKAQRDEFLEAEFAANRQFWADRARAAERAEEARRAIFALRGQRVRVFKGRKVPQGTEGVVFWVGESRYGGYRVGLHDDAGETFWTAESNVETLTEEAVAA